MSAEDAKKFMARVKKDTRLRKRVVRESKGTVDRVVKIAKASGFEFSSEELHDHLKSEWGARKMPSSEKADAFTCIVFISK